MYVVKDCDAVALFMALNFQEPHLQAKSKKKLLNENAFVIVKLSEAVFESSIVMKHKLIQSED